MLSDKVPSNIFKAYGHIHSDACMHSHIYHDVIYNNIGKLMVILQACDYFNRFLLLRSHFLSYRSSIATRQLLMFKEIRLSTIPKSLVTD